MNDKKTAAKLAISTRQVDLSLGAFPFPRTQSVYEFHSPVNPSSQEFLVQKRSGCSHNFREFHPELYDPQCLAQVCAFILVYEQRMSHQPEVEDSPTIFVPLNTPALYRVDQLKGKMGFHKLQDKKKQEEADNFVDGVREHVRLGPKFSETVKGKLSLGARILQVGGVKRVFKQIFGVEGEKLLKASQCYLSTTRGPIAGLLFISSQRIAFCSDRSIKFSSPNGELIRIHYKVSIPLRKIKRANQSENVKNPSQKYMEIVTVDNFDFWFMGFLNYQKAFSYLQQALCEAQNLVEK
ncbi:GEM-like protein 4 [Vitis vinifera]|uniref:GEM-like protein 4 n=1 Tax=Vitis vinifera TaxID=29760 RepID=A0A438K544_VITVI|nr:GEM-like protein 4 [Vitis vinifera]